VGDGRSGRQDRFVHHADEANTLARKCFDKALFFAGIADHASGRI
jgi:hypothetical protein